MNGVVVVLLPPVVTTEVVAFVPVLTVEVDEVEVVDVCDTPEELLQLLQVPPPELVVEVVEVPVPEPLYTSLPYIPAPYVSACTAEGSKMTTLNIMTAPNVTTVCNDLTSPATIRIVAIAISVALLRYKYFFARQLRQKQSGNSRKKKR
jgi:hypothetical protein